MLTEALTAVVAAGGTAVVQAASTDAWTGFKQRLAALMGRGDAQSTGAELERLDRTATAIANASPEQLERVRTLQEGTWQSRLEVWFESASDEERARAAAELQRLIEVAKGAESPGTTYQGDVRQNVKASGNARVYQLGQGEMRISDK